nr:MAG TPA: hypothetical protein [Caudoviricetes sp.]
MNDLMRLVSKSNKEGSNILLCHKGDSSAKAH